VFKDRVLSILNALLIIEKDSSLRALGLSIGTGLVALVIYAAAFGFLSLARRPRPPAWTWALIALAVLDPAYHNRFINPTVPASFFGRPKLLEGEKPPLVVYRATDYFLDRREKSGSNVRFLAYYRDSLYPLTVMADGVRYVFNFDFYGTYPRRYVELVREAKKLPAESQRKILEYLGCRYFVSDSPMFDPAGARRFQVQGFPLFVEKISDKPATPCLAYATVRVSGTEDKLKLFVSPSFDPRRQIMTDRELRLEDASRPGPPAKSAPVVIEEESQGRGRYSVELERPGVVVFPGNYARGWRAKVDGRKADVFEANLFNKGVLVPAGKHEIILRYIPGSFLLGALVSAATAIALLALGVRSRLRLRRRGRPASV
jgi:hypothetical protein